MDIPEFDMRVLADIAEQEYGLSREVLVKKHGKEVLESIDFLQSNNLVRMHEHDLAPFMRPNGIDYKDPPKGNIVATSGGKIEVKRWDTKRSLSKAERWKERAFGFISGVLVSVVSAGIILLLGL